MTVEHVVDPHIHLFDLKGTPRPMQPLGKMFGWNESLLRTMATKMMPKETIAFFGAETDLLGDYMPVNYRSDSTGSKVGPYVHIEAGWKDKTPMDPVGETEWLAGLADGPAAIVAHADLSRGHAARPVLAAHVEASDRVRGIRHSLSWHEAPGVMKFTEDAGLCRDGAFRVGFDLLAEFGLSFDAWCYSNQLRHLGELADHNPEVPMVLCHVGTPVGYAGPFGGVGMSAQERDSIAKAWADDISALAERPHVHCKLSGMLMPVVGFGYENAASPGAEELADKLAPLVEHCIAAFGPQRCMYASNFPVDGVSADYGTVVEALLKITASHGAAAQQAIFADTASSFYRLDAA